jgi:hypothetical protein
MNILQKEIKKRLIYPDGKPKRKKKKSPNAYKPHTNIIYVGKVLTNMLEGTKK